MDVFEVVYRISVDENERPEEMAFGICIEQTVEVDPVLATDPFIAKEVVGQIVELTHLEGQTYRLVIAYRWDIVGENFNQFLNVLYGNISMKRGILVEEVRADHGLFPGPTFGMKGLREAVQEPVHPILCTAMKPLGLPLKTMAAKAYELALAGLHLIKDDHSLNDQSYCGFEERVQRMQEAVHNANARSGGRTLYFPTFAPRFHEFHQSLELLKKLDIRGMLVPPYLLSFEAVAHLVRQRRFLMMSHPTFTGTFFQQHHHGVHETVVLGSLMRWLGMDASIYCNTGGRFPFSVAQCQAINEVLRKPMGRFKPVFPVPAGGMTLEHIPQMLRDYGKDLVILIGGGLLKFKDLREGVQRFRAASHQEGKGA